MKKYIAYLNVDLFDCYFLIRNCLAFLENLLHSRMFFIMNFNFFFQYIH